MSANGESVNAFVDMEVTNQKQFLLPMTGGVGSITGTLFGVFVICLLKTGLPFIGLTANWQQIITGFVLIAAVLVDILKRKAGKE